MNNMNQPNAAPERIELPNGYYLHRQLRIEEVDGEFIDKGYYIWMLETPLPSQTIAIMADDQGERFAAAMNSATPPAPDYAEVLEDVLSVIRLNIPEHYHLDTRVHAAQAALATIKGSKV
jgi:hypothetical protein